MVEGHNVSTLINDVNYARHRLQKRTHSCEFCAALIWLEERFACSSITKPKFGFCCHGGTIKIPLLSILPLQLQNIISQKNDEGKKIRSAIRLYNSILAFTSSSANIDKSLMSADTGIYTYRINGSVHHKISSFMPNDNFGPKFSQIYIYDSEMQSQLRSSMFTKGINSQILNIIQATTPIVLHISIFMCALYFVVKNKLYGTTHWFFKRIS